jgi:hypothetical protein
MAKAFYILVIWIPAIPAGMTAYFMVVPWRVGTRQFKTTECSSRSSDWEFATRIYSKSSQCTLIETCWKLSSKDSTQADDFVIRFA